MLLYAVQACLQGCVCGAGETGYCLCACTDSVQGHFTTTASGLYAVLMKLHMPSSCTVHAHGLPCCVYVWLFPVCLHCCNGVCVHAKCGMIYLAVALHALFLHWLPVQRHYLGLQSCLHAALCSLHHPLAAGRQQRTRRPGHIILS